MGNKLNPARGQFAVFFTKVDPVTQIVFEAGTVLFNDISEAKKFANGVKEHPDCSAQIYMAIGTDCNNASDVDEELFI